jgi:hypothetical protein
MNTHNRLYALLLCGLALLVLLGQAPQAQAQAPQVQAQATTSDTLNMTGDWKLTYGYNLAGCCTRTYIVHFDRDPSASIPASCIGTAPAPGGVRYKGNYKPGGDPHTPLLETPGALMAETCYGDRGQVVVQLVEHVVDASGGYFGLLSGYHVPSTTGVQILGVWTNIDKYRGVFTLDKVP